jgi:hypothetical protein
VCAGVEFGATQWLNTTLKSYSLGLAFLVTLRAWYAGEIHYFLTIEKKPFWVPKKRLLTALFDPYLQGFYGSRGTVIEALQKVPFKELHLGRPHRFINLNDERFVVQF